MISFENGLPVGKSGGGGGKSIYWMKYFPPSRKAQPCLSGLFRRRRALGYELWRRISMTPTRSSGSVFDNKTWACFSPGK
jgi:hypothetical protein